MEFSYEKSGMMGRRPLIESKQATQYKIENLKAIGGKEAIQAEIAKATKLSVRQHFWGSVAAISQLSALASNSFGETRPLMYISAGAIIISSCAYITINKITTDRIRILTEAVK